MSETLDEITEISNCTDINCFIEKVTSNHNKTNLLCMHLNIRSLIKNFAALEQCIHSSKRCIDIVVITEANISDSLSCIYTIDGYQMHTELRKKQRGGGIIIYIHNKHKFTITINKTQHCESVLLNFEPQRNLLVTLCAVYRPPRTSKHLFIDELRNVLKNIDSNNELLLIGDINIDLQNNSPIKHKYNCMLYGCGLVCGISQYTRIEMLKNKITQTCIDHIYARFRTQDVYTATLCTKLADHRAIAFACTGDVFPQTNIRGEQKYKLCFDQLQLERFLSEIEWEQINDMTCPNLIYNFMKNKINNCYKKAQIRIKLSRNPKKENNKWISNKIVQACEYRDTLFSEWLKDTNNMIIRQKYNKARNFANKMILKSKNNYTIREINLNRNNPRNLWNLLNKLTGRIRSSVDKVLLEAFESNSVKPVDIANQFAKTISNSVRNIMPQCHKNILDKNQYSNPAKVSMLFKKANADRVQKIIHSLNKNKAPGVDCIRAMDIKLISSRIAFAIARLINTSVLTGKYPDELKVGIVRPIFKKGSKNNYDNYRPITILSTIDKIIEKYISCQIHKHFNINNILTKKQYGFQPHKSTTQLLSAFTNSVNEHLNSKKHVLIVFIDYSKAFDTIRHNVLIERLDECGVRGSLLKWCENYLSKRYYSVKVGEAYSDKMLVNDGTAQGSVIGPLHFLTYVNNVTNVIKKSELYLFADDTCLLSAHEDVNIALESLQIDFCNLMNWSHDAGLVFNANKTKLMYVSSSQNRKSSEELRLIAHEHQCLHTIKENSTSCRCPYIALVDSHKYLGLTIDSRMKWTEHIDFVSNKLKAILAKFSIIKYRIPYHTLRNLYISLGESIIAYGLTSYGLTCKGNLDKIYGMQLRILKTIVPTKIKLKYKDDNCGLFHHCNILPVHEKLKYMLLVEHFFDKNLQDTYSGDIVTRNVYNKKLVLPCHQNLYGKNRLKYIIPYLINEIPKDIKSSLDDKNIKHKLKTHLLNQI